MKKAFTAKKLENGSIEPAHSVEVVCAACGLILMNQNLKMIDVQIVGLF